MRSGGLRLTIIFGLVVLCATVLAAQGQGNQAPRQGGAGARQGGGGRGGGRGRAAVPQTPAPRNAAGRVILGGKGVWTPSGVGITSPILAKEKTPYQPWAAALYDFRQVNELEPHTRCKPSGGMREFLTPYGVEIVDRHRALGDADATARILLRLLREAQDRDCVRWDDLQRLLAPSSSRRKRKRSALPAPVDRDTTA